MEAGRFVLATISSTTSTLIIELTELLHALKFRPHSADIPECVSAKERDNYQL